MPRPVDKPVHTPNKKAVKGALRKKAAGTAVKAPVKKDPEVSNHDLREAINDLRYEMQNLNSNIGKLYDQLKDYNLGRAIPEDDVPF
jgi:CHAD domain-containing protein